MSNISDRQIAKILARVVGSLAAVLVKAGVDQLMAAAIVRDYTMKAAHNNEALLAEVNVVVQETNEEWMAELAQTAQSIFRSETENSKVYEAPGTARHDNWD